MASPANLPPDSRRGWLLLLALFGGIPLLLFLGAALWYFGRQSAAQAQLDRELADLQAAGLPVDFATLGEFHRSLTDDRRTAQWLRIFAQLDAPSFTEAAAQMPILGRGADVPLPGEPWPEQQAVEAFLAEQQPLLADLHDAASDAVPVWTPAEFEAFDMLGVQERRSAARLLRLEHDAAVYAGQSDRAAQSLRSLFGLTESMRHDPLLVSQLVCNAIHGVTMITLQVSVEQDVLDEAILSELLEHLRRFDDFQTPYRNTMVGERGYSLGVFRSPAMVEGFAAETPFYVFGSRARDALATIDFYGRLERIAEEQNLQAFVESARQVEKELEAEFESAGWLQRLETAMSQMLLPPTAYPSAIGRTIMHNRLASLAVGLRLYQRRFGHWPERLEELRAVGVDPEALHPLGGKPFGYRLEEGTAVLWGFNPAAHFFNNSEPVDEVPDEPPPLDDPQQLNASWHWRLQPAEE